MSSSKIMFSQSIKIVLIFESTGFYIKYSAKKFHVLKILNKFSVGSF